MRVYLVRHGRAEASGAPSLLESDRSLTPVGRALLRTTVQAWVGRGEVPPTRWIVSPYARAVQTCEVCLDAFGSMGPVEISRALLPETRVEAASEILFKAGNEAIALVSHNPLLTTLGLSLLQPKTPVLTLDSGSVLALDLDEPSKPASLSFLLLPATDREAPRFVTALQDTK